MAETEKIFNISLRKEVKKQRRIQRTPKAVRYLKEYLLRHTKAEDVKISSGINELLWASGTKKPPGKIRVKVEIKEKTAFARLPEEKLLEKEAKKGKKGKDSKVDEKAKAAAEKAAKADLSAEKPGKSDLSKQPDQAEKANETDNSKQPGPKEKPTDKSPETKPKE